MLVVLSSFLIPKVRSCTLIEGDLTGVSGVDVYAFPEEQIDSILATETANGRRPRADVFFAKLPLSNALAQTKSGPYSGQFYLSLPKRGNFVIASNYKGYVADPNGRTSDRRFFWLVRLRTNEESTLKLTLTNENMVDTKSPNTIELDTGH